MDRFQSREARDEARNPNSETNPNFPNSKFFPWFDVFEPLDFEFVSSRASRDSIFEFRIFQSV